jgi:hypothetical protein
MAAMMMVMMMIFGCQYNGFLWFFFFFFNFVFHYATAIHTALTWNDDPKSNFSSYFCYKYNFFNTFYSTTDATSTFLYKYYILHFFLKTFIASSLLLFLINNNYNNFVSFLHWAASYITHSILTIYCFCVMKTLKMPLFLNLFFMYMKWNQWEINIYYVKESNHIIISSLISRSLFSAFIIIFVVIVPLFHNQPFSIS